VDAIFHDVAHSTNGDSKTVLPNSAFFPMSRHKSWFDGHSFATGMFPFGNGKSQESSSEAVNCYYGAYLWSLVRHGDGSVGSDLTDFARLLFAMEVRGAKTYWHMIPKDRSRDGNSVALQVYSSTFQQNYMVGNVGMLDVTANTWFGNDALYVHMINAIPITAATAVLFDSKYVQHEYKYLMESRSEVEMAWRGYTISIHAIIDPKTAWEDAQGLVSYQLDAAISKSQVLYWITSRPNFNVTMPAEDEGAGPASSDMASENDESAGACMNHLRCKDSGVSGQCCPTSDGTYLGCCGSSVGGDSQAGDSSERAQASSDNDSSSSCEKHPTCVEAGLSGGACCPTSDEVPVMLTCCA
jgi:hypothetical protein